MNELAKLKPIKPNVPIETANSFNFAWVIILIVLILLILFAIYILKKIKLKKEKETLLSLINNPKKFAYEFTKKAKKYKNQKNEKLLEEILIKLQDYKYKKEVKPIDKNTKEKIKEYLGIK